MGSDKRKILLGFLLTILPAAAQFVSNFWGIHLPVDLGDLGSMLQLGSQGTGAVILAKANPNA